MANFGKEENAKLSQENVKKIMQNFNKNDAKMQRTKVVYKFYEHFATKWKLTEFISYANVCFVDGQKLTKIARQLSQQNIAQGLLSN